MADVLTMTGSPSEITLGGKVYRLSPLTVDDLPELQTWVYSQLPDPVQIAKELAKDMPDDIARDILLTAYEDARAGARKLGTVEANSLLTTPAGLRELLYLHGRKQHPEMTRAAWEQILLEALQEEAATIEAALTEENGGAILDPKASTPGPAASGGPASSSKPAAPPSIGEPPIDSSASVTDGPAPIASAL